MIRKEDFQQLGPSLWELPADYRADMLVPAWLFAGEEMLSGLLHERSLEQLANTAALPGAFQRVVAMPDIHQGYGFPIGGVAALKAEDGVISPGGVGYDINCGVRLLTSRRHKDEVKQKIEALTTQIQRDVPSGVGRGGRYEVERELDQVLNEGVHWALRRGFASEEDVAATEEHGRFMQADAAAVSEKAKARGKDQLGTLGSGNHFLEVQEVSEIFNYELAEAFGLFQGQVVILIHTGSRGLGHQTCTDYVRTMNSVMAKYGIMLPDRELACAPFASPEGQQYFRAMCAAANFAWTNRQLITHSIRSSWRQAVRDNDGLRLLYDVAHNIAKLENYEGQTLLVHRKGATRAFAPGTQELPEPYRTTGQPVLIPGSMGTASYVLAGAADSMTKSFGSCCHGAGRCLSRTAAKRQIDYQALRRQLSDYGVVVRGGSAKGLLEEAPEAYKSVDEVVDVVEKNGLAKIVARLRPLGVVKG